VSALLPRVDAGDQECDFLTMGDTIVEWLYIASTILNAPAAVRERQGTPQHAPGNSTEKPDQSMD
jgi:hypothetical protein